MGFGGVSPWSLILILGIVILLFGTKKLRNIGGDLGGAIKSFKKAMRDGEESTSEAEQQKLNSEQPGGQVIDAKAEHKDKA